jgi:A/G-specific adenine glycosylase
MGRKIRAKQGDKFDGKPLTKRIFVDMLLHWDSLENERQMPWKGEKDPYKVWLSEIILQQTRVEQGLKYYENFIREFPTLTSLARASEARVFKLWEGLGYYSRCRNLIHTAKYIHEELQGKFPADHASLLRLKGVGNYTAAAIASFSYGLPFAVLDGNVFRVLSRIFDLDLPIDSTEGKKKFALLAQEMLPGRDPGKYNQAIMDFGATVCKPVPLCATCFFHRHCGAYRSGRQDLLPVKEKQLRIKERWFYYFMVTCNGHIVIRKREKKDIWQQLHEFPLIESPGSLNEAEQLQLFKNQFGLKLFKQGERWHTTQRLTHQQLNLHFLQIHGTGLQHINGFHWIPVEDLDQYAFPRQLKEFILRSVK